MGSQQKCDQRVRNNSRIVTFEAEEEDGDLDQEIV